MQKDEKEIFIIGRGDLILVTGAGGFLGHQVVTQLIAYGFRNIRCLVRSPKSQALLASVQAKHPDVRLEFLQGDLQYRGFCEEATTGVKVIYHLAGIGGGKSFSGGYLNVVVSTRNLIDAALKNGELIRFVNLGSFSSYVNTSLRRGALLDETCPIITDYTTCYKAYSFYKTEQDQLVIRYGEEKGLPWVILRPGAIYGPGAREWITATVGIRTFGFFMHLGGRNRIPLTYVDNCAEAVVRAGLVPGVEGETFNIVDDNLPRSRAFLRDYKKNIKKFFSLYIPYSLFYLFSWWWERYSLKTKGQLPAVFNRQDTAAMWKGNTYSNEKAKRMLGWTPQVPYREASRRYFEYLRKRLENEKWN